MFNVIRRGLKKPFDKITREDMEEFISSLNRNEFKTKKGQPYSGSTKSDIKKFIKQFWKWKFGDDEEYPKVVSWIKTNISKDERPIEKEVLSYKEVIKFANHFKKIDYKILVLLLFDSGFRIQEMMSVKKKDLKWDNYDGIKKCFWIKCNKSKTMVRNVPVPLFSEEIKTFVNSSYFQNLKDDDDIFTMNYVSICNNLRYAGEKVLGKKHITAHNLRHSSATYYSKEFDGNMNLIADRYGWAYNSDELKLYIRRSGAYQRAGVKKVFDNQLVKIKEENEDLKRRLDDMEKNILSRLYSLIKENPGEIAKAIQIKQKR